VGCHNRLVLSLLTAIGIAALSIVVLVFSAERAVDKVLGLVRHYGYSATFGGLTIFSLMTSLPELFSHWVASLGILNETLDFQIASATVLGANIGSDVIQQTLVLGVVVILMGEMHFKRDFLLTAYLPMIGTTLMCLVLGWDRLYSRVDGAILFGSYLAYLVYLQRREKDSPSEPKADELADGFRPLRSAAEALVLMVLVLVSAHFVLLATELIVRATGLGGSLIGVVSLGVASAAPEMFTAIAGIRKGEVGVSLGTLIGSNITNPLVAIGSGAMISTYFVPGPLVMWDLPMETVTAACLLTYLLLKKETGRLGQGGGVYLICLYAGYLAVRVLVFSQDI
jgi:cation:H+ antiporter